MRENRVRGFFGKKCAEWLANHRSRCGYKGRIIQILHKEMVLIATAVKIERIRWPYRNRTVIATVEQLEAHFC
jgi:hypothetical protein